MSKPKDRPWRKQMREREEERSRSWERPFAFGLEHEFDNEGIEDLEDIEGLEDIEDIENEDFDDPDFDDEEMIGQSQYLWAGHVRDLAGG